MPKKRKTKKQKILHDNKRQTVPEVVSPLPSSSQKETQESAQQTVTPATFSLPVASEKPHTAPEKAKTTTPAVTVSTTEYGYLSTDLMKTALLTGAIVFAELLIRLFFVH
jgi:hypothetical protein